MTVLKSCPHDRAPGLEDLTVVSQSQSVPLHLGQGEQPLLASLVTTEHLPGQA